MLALVLKITVKKTTWLWRTVQTADAIDGRVYTDKRRRRAAPGAAAFRQRDSEQADNRRLRAGRNVQRPGVATNENARAVLNQPGNVG